MSWTVRAPWTKQLKSPINNGKFTESLKPADFDPYNLRLAGISTAGRLGFFIDYSELSEAGTHTFYVIRTHGSTGAIAVQYSTGGDGHNNVTGFLSWADGELSIKSFTVAVTPAQLTNHQTNLGLGEHRIWALLSNPINGAVLHFGNEHTRAYGVIDNNVLASDANAVFYDASAGSNGTGTQASPYNNPHDAMSNIGSKRYFYGKGTTTVDTSYEATPLGGSRFGLTPPPHRESESERLYIRAWGTDTWLITGATRAGFIIENGESYHTYKNIDFDDLATAIAYYYVDSNGINIEGCNASNLVIPDTGNISAYGLWGVDGGRVWRCTADTVSANGSTSNENTALFQTYNGKNISVQRCEASNCSYLTYWKNAPDAFETAGSVRFCIVNTFRGVGYRAAGGPSIPHSYTIAQFNIFKPGDRVESPDLTHRLGSFDASGSNNAEKHWWTNNVFYKGTVAITGYRWHDAVIMNNIFLDCATVWREEGDSTGRGAEIELADYNCEFGTTSATRKYSWKDLDYADAATLNAVNSAFAGNDINQNPLFTDPANGDFSLQAGSPCLTGGPDGSMQGALVDDFYTIGVN